LIELNTERQVVLATGGRVEEIVVEVGDAVQAGDLLLSLDTTYLDWAVEQAEIALESARIDFEELGESILESDIAAAEAALLLAQENLAVVRAGPTQEELAAAESSAAAAWAAYAELQEQPTQAQINQALATLRKAEITVEQAQREYDKIAWLPEAAASAAADNLQRATVDLEAARAAFEEVNKPATEAQLQNALSAAQRAQDSLNKLKLKPTPAELAAAEAEVAKAQAALDEMKQGPDESALRKAELGVRNAMIGLEEARLAQAAARVTAPIDGTVLAVNLDLGQQASAGTVAATLADTRDVKLVANVEQKDISRVVPGQKVVISVYALPEETFSGVVDKIAPTADSGTGFVTFPVIIQITEGPMERVLPGMTASALFVVDSNGGPAMDEGAESDAAPADESSEDAEEGAPESDSSGDESSEGESEEPEADATPAASGG
jgi:HlyD family secretion protein